MEQVNIELTESAYSDLEDIEKYISLDSPAIARKFISKIFDRIDQLHHFPELGKIVPELSDQLIRELLLKKYRIIYRIVDKRNITIIRIVHGSRLLDLEI